MAALTWDAIGDRVYETGVRQTVLYLQSDNGEYDNGVAWTGVTNITETPSGVDSNKLYADNALYNIIKGLEWLSGTINCYTYPDEWLEVDGFDESISQQDRKHFSLCYKSRIGVDTDTEDYKLHIIYNAIAKPSERAYKTLNDSPEALIFSYEFESTPIKVNDIFDPTSLIIIDSRKVPHSILRELEDILYGTDISEPRLPRPNEVIELLYPILDCEFVTEDGEVIHHGIIVVS